MIAASRIWLPWTSSSPARVAITPTRFESRPDHLESNACFPCLHVTSLLRSREQVHPKLRGEGWKGYWIDAASALRMKDDAIIILDPCNRAVIDQGSACLPPTAAPHSLAPSGVRACAHLCPLSRMCARVLHVLYAIRGASAVPLAITVRIHLRALTCTCALLTHISHSPHVH